MQRMVSLQAHEQTNGTEKQDFECHRRAGWRTGSVVEFERGVCDIDISSQLSQACLGKRWCSLKLNLTKATPTPDGCKHLVSQHYRLAASAFCKPDVAAARVGMALVAASGITKSDAKATVTTSVYTDSVLAATSSVRSCWALSRCDAFC